MLRGRRQARMKLLDQADDFGSDTMNLIAVTAK